MTYVGKVDLEVVTPDSTLAGLDHYQLLAVTAPVGLVVVRAGAGSGKTTVLARRIAHRITHQSADAQHVLAFTFTRQAGAELANRLAQLGVDKSVNTGTFHAISYAMLRQRWADTNKTPRTIITSRQQILAKLLPNLRRESLFDISNEIDWCRARMITPVMYQASASVAGRRPPLPQGQMEELLNKYPQEKRKRGVIDLDDLLELSITEMIHDPGYAQQVQWRFRHIHVDEAQDMNPLQHAFMSAIAKGYKDLFIVGDPCQSIYGWNGANPHLFDQLANHTAGAIVIDLPNNYRCSPTIVAAAKHTLNMAGMQSSSIAVGGEGPAVQLHTVNTPTDEAELIARILRAPAVSYGATTSAVLVRTNTQVEPIKQALANLGILVRTSNRINPMVTEALAAGAKTRNMEELLDWADDLRSTSSTDFLADLVAEYVIQSQASIVDGVGFQVWVNTTGALREMPSHQNPDAVEILTFHAAKGRQWNRVVIAGCEKGLSPHSSSNSAEQLAEEARLIYVAITRAEHELHLTRCLSRNNKNCQPSPWLKDMPLGAEFVRTPPPQDIIDRVHQMADPTTELLIHLKQWRRSVANVACTTEVAICPDHVLKTMAEQRPQDLAALAKILGPIQAARHAPKLLAILSN